MQLVGKKKFGKVKVKSMNSALDDIPNDCGYEKKFKFDIDMNSNGIMSDCIEWCQQNCQGKWGWWFDQKDLYDPLQHNWEEQDSYMSFEKKTDATRFWLSIGVKNMNNRNI
jgi:hypothetical protein|tara:strand:- start:228 stop:560 length:333 start_codon:yes stop_codon:yes gene_type:complete